MTDVHGRYIMLANACDICFSWLQLPTLSLKLLIFLGMRQKLQADFLGLYTISAKKPHHITHSVILFFKKTGSLYKAIPGISLA